VTSSPDSALEVRTSRELAVPRARLYRAFADPESLARWWGPSGFTNAFRVFELRPGGAWLFDMHAPDGTAIPMTKRFVEVVADERVVIQHEQDHHRFLHTLEFTELPAGRSRLDWVMRFEKEEELAPIRALVIAANEQNLDRLEALLGERG
jgi:uncharacterized protein YndB with AHSA1/START domain